MPLFSDYPRTDANPKRHTEDMFAFLDRSARADRQRVRETLSAWFERYPASEQPALRRRLQTDFDPPAFELVLHEVLHHAGYTVEVEPEARGKPTRPDFRATRGGRELYLEATVASGTTAEERRQAAVENALFDAINAHPSPDYWLRVCTLTIAPGAQPAARRVKAFLTKAFASTEWARATAAVRAGGLARAPRVTFADEVLQAEFELLPKSAKARGATGQRSIGIYPIRSRFGDAVPSIQAAFEEKAAKYGDLGSPFVIAINATGELGTERWEIEQALYGYEEVPSRDDGVGPRAVRVGVSHGDRGVFDATRPERYRRVSAVVAGTVWPSALEQSTLTVYHNPWASRPLPLDAFALAQVTLEVDGASGPRFVRTSGAPLYQLVGVPDAQPGRPHDT